MKLPDYTVKTPYKYMPEHGDPVEIPVGSLIRPIWNNAYVPEHYKEMLAHANRHRTEWDKGEILNVTEEHVMCIYGMSWVPVPIKNIRKH